MYMDPLQLALQQAGALLVTTVKGELKRAGKSATGALIKSISFSVDTKTNTLVVSGLPYLKWVDEGRKPGKMPPVSKIIPWVQAKRIKFAKTDKATAFIIARSIGKKGIKPTNVLANSRKKAGKQISKIISKGASELAMQRVRSSFRNI